MPMRYIKNKLILIKPEIILKDIVPSIPLNFCISSANKRGAPKNRVIANRIDKNDNRESNILFFLTLGVLTSIDHSKVFITHFHGFI